MKLCPKDDQSYFGLSVSNSMLYRFQTVCPCLSLKDILSVSFFPSVGKYSPRELHIFCILYPCSWDFFLIEPVVLFCIKEDLYPVCLAADTPILDFLGSLPVVSQLSGICQVLDSYIQSAKWKNKVRWWFTFNCLALVLSFICLKVIDGSAVKSQTRKQKFTIWRISR